MRESTGGPSTHATTVRSSCRRSAGNRWVSVRGSPGESSPMRRHRTWARWQPIWYAPPPIRSWSPDTTTPPMRHVRLRLETAYGWRAGPWGIGAGLGLEMSDDRTRKARAARLGRVLAPALSFGLLRVLSAAGLSVLAFGRWAEANENSRIALPGGIVTEVVELDGLGGQEAAPCGGPQHRRAQCRAEQPCSGRGARGASGPVALGGAR